MCNGYTESTPDLNGCQTVSDAASLYSSIPTPGLSFATRGVLLLAFIPLTPYVSHLIGLQCPPHLLESCTFFDRDR